jgi:hypothetical protein
MNEFEKFLVANYPDLKVGADVPENILREASIAYQARQEQATQQSTAVLDSIPAVQAAPVISTPNADEASRVSYPQTEFDLFSGQKQDNPLVEVAETIQDEPVQPAARAQEPVQESGDLRGYFQQLLPVVDNYRSRRASIAANNNYRSDAAKRSDLAALDNRLESEITNLQRGNRWDPRLDSMIKAEVEAGVPKVEAVARAFSRYTSADEPLNDGQEAPGADERFNLAEYKRTVGEDTPVAQAGGAFMSNQAWTKLGREVYETPRGMMDAATAVVKASLIDDENAPAAMDNNLQVVESGFDYWRRSEPQRLKIAREVLGDRAGDTSDLTELKRSMSDSQSSQYKDLLTRAGLRNPEIIPVITKGPGAVNNDEILRRVQMASQMDIPLLDVSFDEKTGARSAQSVNMNPTVAASYMRTYGPKAESGEEDRATRLQKIIDDPDAPLADRAQAEVALSREKSPGIVASVVGAVGGLLKSDPELAQLQAEYESLANSVFDPPFRQSGYTWRSKVPPKGNRKTGVSDETLEKTVYTLEDLRKRINARRQSLQKK